MTAADRHPNAPREKPHGASRTQTVYKVNRTRPYTAISMDIVNDNRLQLDERMALIWALARPPDWQFHPGQLRDGWNVGRVIYYRIIKALKRTGYLKVGEMVRSADNRYWVAINYVFFDVPQTPDEPVEGVDDNEDDDDEPPPAAAPPDDSTVANSSHVGFVHADDLHAGDRPGELKIDITKNNPPYPPKPKPPPDPAALSSEDKSAGPLPEAALPVAANGSGPPMRNLDTAGAKNDPPVGAGPPGVEEFLAKYPRGHCLSEDRVRRRWLRLADADRIEALARLPDFLADRDRRKWKLCDAATYVKDRLWRAFAAAPPIYELTPTMPEWHRWMEHYTRTGSTFMVEQMNRMAREKKSFPSKERWPPGQGQGDATQECD